MNLTAVLAELYRRLRYTSAPPSNITTRLTAFVNDAHRELCALDSLTRLREDVIVITATANIARTGLPPTVSRLSGITDRTNNIKLRQVPLSELRATDPGQLFTGGYPHRYAVIGNQAVQRQPSVATGLWIVSSAVGDTTQHAYVESILTGGYPNDVIGAGTALNGTTRVQIGARTDHLQVTRFYLDAAATGFVSLYDAAVAGNELARLPIGQLWSRYLAVEWWPIQTLDVTEYADITHQIYDLVKGTDEPLLPVEFHETLVVGALMREYVMTGQTEATMARLDYERGKSAIESWVMNDGDRIASLRQIYPRWQGLTGSYGEHY